MHLDCRAVGQCTECDTGCISGSLIQCSFFSSGNNAALNLLQLLDRYSKPVAAAAKAQTLTMPLSPPAGSMPRLMLIVETLDNLLQ